jgi:hypothetical protein
MNTVTSLQEFHGQVRGYQLLQVNFLEEMRITREGDARTGSALWRGAGRAHSKFFCRLIHHELCGGLPTAE